MCDLPNSGGAMVLSPVAPPGSNSPAQYDPCHLPLVAFLQQLLGPVMSRDFQPFLLSLSRCTTWIGFNNFLLVCWRLWWFMHFHFKYGINILRKLTVSARLTYYKIKSYFPFIWKTCTDKKKFPFHDSSKYCTRATITSSWLETALEYHTYLRPKVTVHKWTSKSEEKVYKPRVIMARVR